MAEEKKEQQPSGSDFQQGHIPNEQNDSEMRGVHANVSLPSNTVCMSVPRRCLITVEMGQDTPIGQAVLSSDLDLDAPKHIFLVRRDSVVIVPLYLDNNRNHFLLTYSTLFLLCLCLSKCLFMK